MNKAFNIVIAGVGGQGLITLAQIVAEAAFLQGYVVKVSEIHGLSQRGGAVETHIRFGREIFSPMAPEFAVNLVLGLEMQEGLRECLRAGKQTKFLINEYLMPFAGSLKKDDIKNHLQNILKNNLYLVPASKICSEKLQNEVAAGIYLLGYAVRNNLMPLKEKSILAAIKNFIPKKYQELNIKAFQLAKND